MIRRPHAAPTWRFPESALDAPRRIAIQGDLGSYSHEAVERLWGPAAECVPCRESGDALDALLDGRAHSVILPIENCLIGAVTQSLEAVAVREGFRVTGELILPVRHCLLGLPGSTLDGLTRVQSHPVALAQCGTFLARHPGLELLPAYDTAGAAREIAAAGDRRRAAIASRGAALRHGLQVLAPDIADRGDNATRFWVFERRGPPLAPGLPARTALLLAVPDVPHALVGVLRPLVDRRLDIRRLDLRPGPTARCQRLLLEIAHAAGDPAVATALAELEASGAAPRMLGTFARTASSRAEPVRRRAAAPPPPPPPAPVPTPAPVGVARRPSRVSGTHPVAPPQPAARLRGIRGAVSVEGDRPELIREATGTLLTELLARNGICPAQVVSAVFTATGDLVSDFPAHAARELGWNDVPLLCATEIPVPGSLPRCIRVLLHVELPVGAPVHHVYLGAAEALRPDLGGR